jgi:hypothetical protein
LLTFRRDPRLAALDLTFRTFRVEDIRLGVRDLDREIRALGILLVPEKKINFFLIFSIQIFI